MKGEHRRRLWSHVFRFLQEIEFKITSQKEAPSERSMWWSLVRRRQSHHRELERRLRKGRVLSKLPNNKASDAE